MSALRAFFLLSDHLTFFSKSILFFSHLLCYWLTGEPRFSLNVSQETGGCLTFPTIHREILLTKDEDFCEQGAAPKGATTLPKHWTGFEFLEMALPFSMLLASGSSATRLRLHLRSTLPVATGVRICISWSKPPLAWLLFELLLAKYWWWKYSKNNRRS